MTAERNEEEMKRIRRRRSVALGIALAVFAALFYAITIVKMGPAIMNRPL